MALRSIDAKPDHGAPVMMRNGKPIGPIREPVQLNAADAALLTDAIHRAVLPIAEKAWMIELLREGSTEFREVTSRLVKAHNSEGASAPPSPGPAEQALESIVKQCGKTLATLTD